MITGGDRENDYDNCLEAQASAAAANEMGDERERERRSPDGVLNPLVVVVQQSTCA